jgi:hypothetical protein
VLSWRSPAIEGERRRFPRLRDGRVRRAAALYAATQGVVPPSGHVSPGGASKLRATTSPTPAAEGVLGGVHGEQQQVQCVLQVYVLGVPYFSKKYCKCYMLMLPK